MNLSSFAPDIGRAGEQLVVNWLRANGWCVESWNTQGSGATDIVASKSWIRVLIQVKTALYPNSPASVSDVERRAICSRAKRTGCQAYVAQVMLDWNTLEPIWWHFVLLE
jgi:Holliday junction resolvase-like predicted endonuclease